MTSVTARLAAMFPMDAESIAERDEFELSGMDDVDELDEADAQACWALEIQSEMALMNQRSRY